MAINYQGGDNVTFQNAINSTLGVLQRFGQQEILKQQKEQESRKSDLGTAMKEISRLDANGIREIDVKDVSTKYNGLKETYFRLSKAQTADERTKINFELNNQISDINRDVARSKELKKYESDGWNLISNDKYDPNALKGSISKLKSTPVSQSWDYQFDGYSGALKGFDEGKATSAIAQVDKALLDDLDKVQVSARSLGSGLRGISTNVSPEVAIQGYSALYDANSDVRAYVDSLAERNGVTPEEQLISIVENRIQQGTLSKSTVGNTPRPRSGGITINLGGNQYTPEASVVDDYVIAENEKTGQIVNMSKYLQFNQPQTIAGVIKAINPETGENETLKGTTETKVIGIGNRTGKDYLVVTDPNYKYPLLIDKNSYLNKLSLTKAEKAGLTAFDNAVADQKKRSDQSYAQDAPRQTSPRNSVSSQTREKLSW